jgi:hypothetical protein
MDVPKWKGLCMCACTHLISRLASQLMALRCAVLWSWHAAELMFPCEVWFRCFFRHTLEKIGQLDPYVSAVDLDEDALEAEVYAANHLYPCCQS